MAEANRSKLVRMTVRNIGCIGDDGLTIDLDNIVCLVGRNNSGKSTILRAYELARSSLTFERSRDRHQHAADERPSAVSYTHLRAHETSLHLVCRLLLVVANLSLIHI